MVHRANDIALFWEPYPHDEAVAAVLRHIQRYWNYAFAASW